MTPYVPRTCTETSAGNGEAAEPKPISEFRSKSAYVLLGDPGSGKTTEFERERTALGDAAVMISARDFIASDAYSHPDWKNKVLFIDGLDEMRAGGKDPLTPLDRIRNRLDRLGRPRFRLSCREADWLGQNDRQSLSRFSPDGSITELRLDPLDTQAAKQLLQYRLPNNDPAAFVTKAWEYGVEGMLRNPLTLTLLAAAVEHGEAWPQTRQETFAVACQRMATEQNDVHQIGSRDLVPDAVLDAAGCLCALMLLTGAEGISRSLKEADTAFIPINTITSLPPHLTHESLYQALGTTLFTAGSGNQRFQPLHRHIAEYLGGRYLAYLVGGGLPVRRVVALMASPYDGGITTDLRGLSAWLTTESRKGRHQLINVNPVGVGLYGDISVFSLEEKEHLFQEFQAQPLSLDVPLYDLARACRSLASKGMIPAITKILAGNNPEHSDQQMLLLTLAILSEAEDSKIESLAVLVDDLETILFNTSMQSEIKDSALEAYLHIQPYGKDTTEKLLGLLSDIQSDRLADLQDQLRGRLLNYLYPTTVQPSQVWQFALDRAQTNFFGNFGLFWHHQLLEQSSDDDVVQLLDALYEEGLALITGLSQSGLGDLPFKLLAHALYTFGKDTELLRLFKWLHIVGQWQDHRIRTYEHANRIRAWLQDHPEIQKDVFLAWLRQPDLSDRCTVYEYGQCLALHRSIPPADFGLWCLNKSIAIVESEPIVAEHLLRQAYHSLKTPEISEGLTVEMIRGLTQGHHLLSSLLDQLSKPRPEDPYVTTFEQEQQERSTQYEKEKQQTRDGWETALKAQIDDVYDNRLQANNLYTLALAYFNKLPGFDKEATPSKRVADLINGDPKLVEIVMQALQEAVFRNDIPDSTETIQLHSQSQMPYLAYPVLSSLDLLYKANPERLDRLNAVQKSSALAIYYYYPTPHGFRGPSLCHDYWFQQDPELVLGVLHRCTLAALKTDNLYIPGLNDLDRLDDRDTKVELVHQTRLKLLESFPLRATKSQNSTLDQLLAKSLTYSNPAQLSKIAKVKVAKKSITVSQRVRWMLVDALFDDNVIQVFREYVSDSQQRVRQLCEFVCDYAIDRWLDKSPVMVQQPLEMVAGLIELLGPTCEPHHMNEAGWVSQEMKIADRVDWLIWKIASFPSVEASHYLDALTENPDLIHWQDHLELAMERQSSIRSDAEYSYPSLEQVQGTLAGQGPTNTADLAALFEDVLSGIASDIRGSNRNLWRQFWNEDQYGRPTEPKPEDSCRDALLVLLSAHLPDGIDLAPEGRYAAEWRADITVNCGGFNVPIEIKKNSHRDLWTSMQNQLIDHYTTDPATSGHGIYLVLWSGADETTRHHSGARPTTPDELRHRLESQLTPDEAHKIAVVVLDVTKPE